MLGTLSFRILATPENVRTIKRIGRTNVAISASAPERMGSISVQGNPLRPDALLWSGLGTVCHETWRRMHLR
jgi:hypothetical protein